MIDIEKTIAYYNLNAKSFAAGTVSVEFENTQNGFIGNEGYNKGMFLRNCMVCCVERVKSTVHFLKNPLRIISNPRKPIKAGTLTLTGFQGFEDSL